MFESAIATTDGSLPRYWRLCTHVSHIATGMEVLKQIGCLILVGSNYIILKGVILLDKDNICYRINHMKNGCHYYIFWHLHIEFFGTWDLAYEDKIIAVIRFLFIYIISVVYCH